MPAPQSPPRLDVGQALREGWRAFLRAPWHFVAFGLLVTALQLLLQALQPSYTPDKLPPLDPESLPTDLGAALAWLRYGTVTLSLLVLNVIGGTVLNLWGTSGMVRAAWVALGGGRPSFATFTHWDPRALLRLYLPGFLLGCGVVAAISVLLLLGVIVSQVNGLLLLLPGLLLVAGSLYLSLTQAFLPQVALLHDDHPFAALARGPEVVAPAWPQVVELTLLSLALIVAGLLACGVGLFVAVPVVTCVGTAAYRQLFGPDDRTGFSRSVPKLPF